MKNPAEKVTAGHLSRRAYLYVRQSTLRQVAENRESTERQYALRERALALGWPHEQVEVIDCDLGKSGASTDREGFQRLVAEVGMGRAGIVLGLEVSRLARNSADWHRLLEICALTRTLLLDEDGLYDPGQFNDRLLLGLKGTMSEAELHFLRARLLGGMLNKARRGELRIALPVGLVYDPADRVVLDPDRQVQDVLRHFFETFRQLRSAGATVRRFREQGLQFPRRPRTMPARGELFWVNLTLGMAFHALHNPRYAGAFVYGRRAGHRRADGSSTTVAVAPEDWEVLLPGAHEGYLTWEEFLENQQCLRENSEPSAAGRPHRPREGPALLQGIAMSGLCGSGMSPRYHTRRGVSFPTYVCNGLGVRYAARQPCQSVPGKALDEAIGALLLEAVTPMALEAALAVQAELRSRLEAADRLRWMEVERAQHEVDLARRRYMQVDPDNRLVADTLEADWNARLRDLREAQDRYERRRAADEKLLSEEQAQAVRDLAGNLPRLWKDPAVPHQERKRMVRLLLEDVTLVRSDGITVHVRFRGGTTRTLVLPAPEKYWQARKTSPEVVRAIDELLENHTEGAVAQILNERGLRSGQDLPFHAVMVNDVRDKYGLKTRFDRLRERGLLTVDEMAEQLGVATCSVTQRRRKGQLKGWPLNDKGEYLYEEPGPHQRGRKGLTHPEVIQAIDELLEEHTEREIADLLNKRGLRSGMGRAFTEDIVLRLRQGHGLEPRLERLRRRGLLTVREAAQLLGVPVEAVLTRRRQGRLAGHKANEKGEYLFETERLLASNGTGGAV